MESDIRKILLTEEQIRQREEELGKILTQEYAGKNPVIVGVLKGVVVFYADMVRQIHVPCQMDFMWLSSYSGAASGELIVRQDISSDIRGRHVLILEDIYDTGSSLWYTYQHLMAKAPASLKICTLLDKPERRRKDITLRPDYVGFTISNEFVVGYGLDYNERYRNLPFIGILRPEVYEK